MSPLRFLERSAAVFPDRTAIIHGDRTYTYAAFADETQRLARVLRSRIEPGDKVAYLTPNVPEMLIAHFAVPLAGGVLVALNSRLAGPELEYILDHSETKLLFVDSELLGSVANVRDNVPGVAEIIEVPDSTVPVPDVPAGVATARYDEFLAQADSLDATPLPW
ncbi:AMP-binding protein, partial [Rhodococcus rhodochrous]